MPPLDVAGGANDWVTAPAPAAAPSVAAGKDDWVTAPAQHWAAPPGGEFGDLAAQAAAPAWPQGQAAADVNAVGQGLVSGTGAAIAGAGRIAQAGSGPDAQKMLASLDLVDQGKNAAAYQKLTDAQRVQIASYIRGGPDDRQAQRDALQQTIEDYNKPNAVTRAGMAVEGAAPSLFPVDPANEGIQTGVGRMIGGTAPALVAGAPGGPVGILASLATIGSQAYDGAYQDAVSKGATHEQADDAAGRSALAQSALMVAPVGRLLQRVPVPLRDGLTATLVNLGQHGVEFGTANGLGTFANNYVAQQTYDPGRPLTQGTGNAALEGAIAGLVIPAIGGAVRTARAPAVTVDDVMAAPDVDSAIAAAGKAAQAPSVVSFVPPEQLVPAPSFVPPGSRIPALPQLHALLAADNQVAANKPSFIPPDATQPPNPLTGMSGIVPSFGELFAARPVADAGLVPQSVGAAASRQGTPLDQIALSNTDMKANRYQAEMNELLAPPSSGDRNIYVPGSLPTLAEYSGDPEISQQENLIRQRNPSAFIGDGKRLTENNTARVAEFENQTPSRTALDMMRDDRNAQWEADSKGILPNAQPADLSPAMDWVEGQLADPKIQENDAVRNVLQDFSSRLVDENGDLKTDPAAVWGIHDNIQNQLAKAKDPLNATGAEKYAFNELMQAKSLVDGALNTATGNQFQTALDNYTKASQAINAGEELESFRPKLTNASGAIMGDRFHKFVVDLAARRGDPGIDPAMSISDDTMRSLMNIDNDLKRAGLIKLGAAAGSPTNLLGALAGRMGLGAAHMVAGHLAPGIGNMILHAGGDAAMGALGKYRLDKLTAKHLAPPEGGYVYPGATP
jgi:hypothetical protein